MSEQHVSCQEVVELVSDYVEGALPPDVASLFEEHLNFCDGCVVYVEQLRDAVAATERIREEDLPSHVRDSLLTAFRNWRDP